MTPSVHPLVRVLFTPNAFVLNNLPPSQKAQNKYFQNFNSLHSRYVTFCIGNLALGSFLSGFFVTAFYLVKTASLTPCLKNRVLLVNSLVIGFFLPAWWITSYLIYFFAIRTTPFALVDQVYTALSQGGLQSFALSLIKKGVLLNYQTSSTILSLAAQKNGIPVISYLLKIGVSNYDLEAVLSSANSLEAVSMFTEKINEKTNIKKIAKAQMQDLLFLADCLLNFSPPFSVMEDLALLREKVKIIPFFQEKYPSQGKIKNESNSTSHKIDALITHIQKNKPKEASLFSPIQSEVLEEIILQLEKIKQNLSSFLA